MFVGAFQRTDGETKTRCGRTTGAGTFAAAWKQDAGVKAPPHPASYGCGGVAIIAIASGILRMPGVDEDFDFHLSGAQFPLTLRTGRPVLERDVRVLAWPPGFLRTGC